MQPVSGTADQRQHRRFSFVRPVEYSSGTISERGPWCNGRALDLSFGGIRIVTERRVHEDDLVQIRLDPDSAAAGFVAGARIVHVQPDSAGQWLFGCEFLPIAARAG